MLKFGVKVGLAGGACYYLAEEGVWRHSTETTKLYNKIADTVSPIIKDNSPIEIPDLPSSDRISYLTKHYWNQGVLNTFGFIEELPEHVSEWAHSGATMINGNPEMKKFLDSFTAAPTTEPTPEPVPISKEK